MLLKQQGAEPFDAAQRRAQVVRGRVGEGFQLAVDDLQPLHAVVQLLGALLHLLFELLGQLAQPGLGAAAFLQVDQHLCEQLEQRDFFLVVLVRAADRVQAHVAEAAVLPCQGQGHETSDALGHDEVLERAFGQGLHIGHIDHLAPLVGRLPVLGPAHRQVLQKGLPGGNALGAPLVRVGTGAGLEVVGEQVGAVCGHEAAQIAQRFQNRLVHLLQRQVDEAAGQAEQQQHKVVQVLPLALNLLLLGGVADQEHTLVATRQPGQAGVEVVGAIGHLDAVVQLLQPVGARPGHGCMHGGCERRGHDLADGAAQELLGPAIELVGACLVEHEALLGVHHKQHVPEHVEDLLEGGVALACGGLGLPQIGHVQAGADVADEALVGVVAGPGLFVHPAVHAVVAAQAVFHAIRTARIKALVEDLLAAVPVLRMQVLQPEGLAFGGQVAAGEVEPGLVEPVRVFLVVHGPGQTGRGIGHRVQVFEGLSLCFFQCLAVGDLEDRSRHVGHPAHGVAQAAAPGVEPAHPALGVDGTELDAEIGLAPEETEQGLAHASAVLRMDQPHDDLLHLLLRRRLIPQVQEELVAGQDEVAQEVAFPDLPV